MTTAKLPYWQLSSVYFFYFASLGVLMPYLGLYLQSLGFVAAQVGLVFAVIQGTKIVAPNIWAWVADVSQQRVRMVQVAAFIAVVVFSLFLYKDSFFHIIVISFVFSFFWNAMLPQFEAVTLTLLGRDVNRYSRIRLWGSVGFIVAVVGAGILLDSIGLQYWPTVVILFLALVFVSSLLVTESSPINKSINQETFISKLKNRKIIAFFVVVFLIQASHGPYYSFFSILLNAEGYSETQIGQFWSLGVVAEILLFFVMYKVFKRFSLRQILLFSITLTVVRWLLIAWFANSLTLILISQLLHAASFGAFHVVCIQLVHQYFIGAYQARGQALYSSIGFGAGGMCGSLMAGYLWESLGSQWVFSLAAALSVGALLVTWVWLIENDSTDMHVSEQGLFNT
jgi:PPP family 3-phenylpropionic acid transporter